MKKTLLVVPFLVIGMVAFAPDASAIQDPFKLSTVQEPIKKKTKPQTNHIRQAPKVIPPVEYGVVEGDTLSKIAQSQNTTVDRLWLKNTQLTSPDLLLVGEKLAIPSVNEVLAPRAAPVAPIAPINTRPVVPGNGYDYGNCTFYVKTKRPDIGNFWGNADQWGYSAAAAGYQVNGTPSVGSIGVAIGYMHVVFLEQVDGNRVYVSEMNYQGLGVVSHRWTDASEFTYIHY